MSDGHMLLVAPCIRCGQITTGDPDTIASVWVHTDTRCCIRPDGQQITPGEPDTAREPLCPGCARVIEATQGRSAPLTQLFPLARFDRIEVAK